MLYKNKKGSIDIFIVLVIVEIVTTAILGVEDNVKKLHQ